MGAMAEKKSLQVTFIFVVAMHTHLATVLTEPLCKLQSEAGLGLFAFSLGEAVRKEKTDPRLASTETAAIAVDIYIQAYIFLQCFLWNLKIKGIKGCSRLTTSQI